MRIGEVRTSIKLEPEFWGYLKEVAQDRSIRLSRLVNEVAMASPERTNLASTLRTFSRDIYYNFCWPWSGSVIAIVALGVPLVSIVIVLIVSVWGARGKK